MVIASSERMMRIGPTTALEALQDSSLQKYEVLGIRLAALQIPNLISHIESWISHRESSRVIIFANVHVVMEAQYDAKFKTILNSSVTVPDGTPLIWIGRRRGFSLKRRVYGPDLMIDFIRETSEKGYRHFFYGGAPGVAEQLAKKMKMDNGTEVVGVYSPPFRTLTPQEDARIIQMINDARPDVLWVGLGCPKQEKWAYGHRDLLRVPIICAVGQAFDIHSGNIKQAPQWMRENGMEWFYRLISEPRRLWKRYLVFNCDFIARFLISACWPFKRPEAG